ncbi:MAG: RES family NAD+ phosphorylase [Nitrospinae bacterium]|nr:RES family NAD+ phosphorylase [Nitrospinota bacterium]
MISHNEIEELEKRTLCVNSIEEQFLKAKIDDQGKIGSCHYCKERRKVTTIGQLANEIHGAFEQHYQLTAAEPSDLEYSLIKETGYVWWREGEPIVNAIEQAAEINEIVAEDIRKVLEYHHSGRYSVEIGGEGPYDEEAHYEDAELDDVEYRENWRSFENSLKTKSRFFSAEAEAVLDRIFERLMELRSTDGKSVFVEAGPGTEMTVLYRARVFQTLDELGEALKRPDVQIGPPPATLAKAGRMNANGIAVFYGATKSEISISEVRPPVGSQVVVGRFELIRKMRLLDVSVLRSAYVKGSVFDPTYIRRLERAKFLRGLSERISQPVMPDDEPLEYLVTQAIADYLAGKSDPEIDGIIYPSVQDSSGGSNVVLFHKSSRVESIVLILGTEIDVQFGHQTEEGWETDYWVSEEIPPSKPEDSNEIDDDVIDFARMTSHALSNVNDDDLRKTTLRLDLESLAVHHVEGARYETEAHSVTRHRWEKREFRLETREYPDF